MSERQRENLQSAFVLHSRPYRETSALLEVFTRDHGRMTLVARGVRGKSAGSGAVLRPFCPLLVSWSGRSKLATLTAVEAVPPGIHLHGKALFCGIYMNELLVRFLHEHDPYPDLFAYYAAALVRLAGPENLENTLRYFELALLEEAGFALQIESLATSGGEIVLTQRYHYEVGKGVVPLSGNRAGILGSTLAALRQRNLNDENARREAKLLMRQVIDYHLDGRGLSSRGLFPSAASARADAAE